MHKYPRLLLLILSYVLAFFLFQAGAFDWLDHINGYGYISIFLGGMLFSFGFTTPFGIAVFVEVAPFVNPALAALVAGAGAFLSDLLIFDLIRYSALHDELFQIRATRLFRKLHSIIFPERMPERIRRYLMWSFVGIVIASPLPDEFGVTLISGITDMKPRHFGAICFLFNTGGIFLVLLAARAIV